MGSLNTFNGTTDNQWDVDSNWSLGVKPVNTDWVTIAADCVCDTDESANILSGGNSTVNSGITLTIQTGGHIKVQNRVLTLPATGILAMDGGTLTLERTTATTYIGAAGGTITGSANGGTIYLNTNSTGNAVISRCHVLGNVASRLDVIAAGANDGRLLADNVPFRLENLHVDGCYIDGGSNPLYIENIDLENVTSTHAIRECKQLILNGGFIHGNGSWGVANASASLHIAAENTVFGETPVGGADANSNGDVYGIGIAGRFYNCKFSSATEFGSLTQLFHDIRSTSHDQDSDYHVHYFGVSHKADTVFGASAQGGSGTAWRVVSSAYCSTAGHSLCRRLLCTIPADDGDLIDVTCYLKGTNTKTAVLRIDPEGLYGTTQAYNETADGNWNQRTIPQYTVATGGSEKVRVPVYLDIDAASETWYYDTLERTIS